MARGRCLNTYIVLAAVDTLSGLFRVVSAVEPSLFCPLPPLSPSLISILASVDVKQHVRRRHKKLQSPGEIKRREMSWTLMKLDAFAGSGEIKRRDVVPDPQVSPEEIKSREVELGLRAGLLLLQSILSGRAMDIVFVTLFCIAVGTAIAWCCGRCAMPDGLYHNILLFRWQPTATLVFQVGTCFEVSLFCPPFPTCFHGR